MGSLSKIEKAIYVTQHILKKIKDKTDGLSRRLDLNEGQKIFIGEQTELIQNVTYLIDQYDKEIKKNFGKMPPQALDLEEAVLGAVMMEKGASIVMTYLMPDHFYTEPHKTIMQACRNLHDRKDPIDMRTVVAELRKNGTIEAAGGAYYIAELTSRVSSAANIEYHARIVIEMAMKRRLIEMAGRIMSDAYDDKHDVFDLLKNAEEEFKLINEWTKR